jgi:drug/metabolite transporter (DMT)-like permease
MEEPLMSIIAVLYALSSAVLFGASTPAAKVLVGTVHPAILAGLLYCGAGIGIAALRRLRTMVGARAAETPLSSSEWPWLAGAVLAGGVAGPPLLMWGLTQTGAAEASLLLTLEGAATALIAWFVFHESVDRRLALGMILLLTGAAVLAWTGTPSFTSVAGPVAIIGACLAWGVDNNLTRKVSLSDPLQIVQIKGLVAGPVSLALGLFAGGAIPAPTTTIIAAVVGFLGYGVSLALFIFALRSLGAARTGAYFGTAPFFGAALAVIALGESMTLQLALAGLLMAGGVWLHLTERHEHAHRHDAMLHAHPHVHDSHHRHAHTADDPSGEPHTHAHRHEPMTHEHPHTPDMHHAHRHGMWQSLLGRKDV